MGICKGKEKGNDKRNTKLGNYGAFASSAKDADTTIEVVNALLQTDNYSAGKNIYSEVYAKIKPGDAILKKDSTWGHVRLVVGVTIVRDSDGDIDAASSKIHYIGQAGFRKDSPNAITSWENTSASFSTLVNNKYIPIRMNNIDE